MKKLLLSLFLGTTIHAEIISQVAENAPLKEPFGSGFDASGNLWIVEMASGNRTFRVNPQGEITHFAGKIAPGYAGDNGPALEASFNGPHNLVVLPNGNVLLADTWNGVIREIDVQSQTVRTLPGWKAPTGKERANGPYCITLSPDSETLHIANLNQVIALHLPTQKAKVVAGNGQRGVPEDGALAIESPLVDPRAAAADTAGNLYILERGGNALRVVDAQGRIRTVVNRSGKKGQSGDGGPALEATMNGPKHLCIDTDDSVLIADAENHLIRRYIPATGKIKRVAGTGERGSEGLGGAPLDCKLARPHGVNIHPTTGDIYLTDSYNDRILKITR